MRTMFGMVGLVLVGGLLAVGSAAVADETAKDGKTWSSCLTDRVEVGTRVTYFKLEDDQKNAEATSKAEGSFYGSITELDAQQNYIPLKLFVDYKFTKYVGAEVTVDEIQADTITRSDGHNDGTVDMWGPIVSLFGRYPNSTRFIPYAGAGMVYFWSDFKEEESWKHGNGNDQTFDLDDSTGWVAYGGVSAKVTGRWFADLYVRHMDIDVDGTHYNHGRNTGVFTFPMSNDAVGLGVRYIF